MIALVRIALSRPYTFVVLALLLLIIGPLAALRTPTDIFPDIRIPVIGVVSSMLVLGERPSWQEFTAMALVLAAIATVIIPPRNRIAS